MITGPSVIGQVVGRKVGSWLVDTGGVGSMGKGRAMTIDTWVNIGAIIIGLVGLFYSMRYNGRLAREQQERQWKHEITRAEEKDRRERIALQSALRIELQDIHGSIRTHIKYAKEAQNAGSLLVGRATLSTEVYQAALPRIGILPKNQIRILTQAYKGLETQSEKVKLLGQDYEAGQVKIPAKHCDTFISHDESSLVRDRRGDHRPQREPYILA